MPIGRQYRDAIHVIAEPRQRTAAAIRMATTGDQGRGGVPIPTGFSDGELQAVATIGAWNDTFWYPARSHVNTMATMGYWPEDLPAEPLQPIATIGYYDEYDCDPDIDYPATQGLMI